MVTKDEVNSALNAAREAYMTYTSLRDQAEKAGAIYYEKSRVFQELDRQLAMVDGRFKKVETKDKKLKKEYNFTMEQLKAIADILNVNLEGREEDDLRDEDENLEEKEASVEGQGSSILSEEHNEVRVHTSEGEEVDNKNEGEDQT